MIRDGMTISAGIMRAAFEAAIGRGWQKAVAQRLGVAESTVSLWSREGVPPIAQAAVRLAIEAAAAPPSPWVLADGPGGQDIVDMSGATPRIIARDVAAENAHLIATAPALRDAAEAALAVLRRESGGAPPDAAAAKEVLTALEAAVGQADGKPTRVAAALETAAAAAGGPVRWPFQEFLTEMRNSLEGVEVPGFDPDG
ncbi:MAG: hypothetical protein WCJ64_06420, partial [Rhodospirillaceae bacterium]